MTTDPTAELKRLRSSIDNIDAAVVHMLAERFKATKAVGELKAAHAMPRPTPVGGLSLQPISVCRVLARTPRTLRSR